jgi:hypothetical protein
MWRFAFCVCILRSAEPLVGQAVPARDLLEFPIGTLAEAPLLATLAGDGTWNPAAILLPPGIRARVVASALDGASEQGVTMQSVALGFSLGTGTTAGVSALRASIPNLIRTDEDPQSVGPDIAYGTQLVSASIARKLTRRVDAGIAVRYQRGEADADARGAMILDAGVLVHSLGKRDLRIAAATFLQRADLRDADRANTRFSFAGDVRVMGTRDEAQVRAGYSFASAGSLGREHYASLAGRWQAIEVRGGLLVTDVYGKHSQRTRLGIALRSATVTVGLAQEQNLSGISPTYQVVVASLLGK